MTSGPLMVGIAGCELDPCEVEVLRHPSVGGVILFSRNYRSRTQLRALCDAIHDLKRPPLLIGVDHEGGRVQRFRDGFTALPAAAVYGALHDRFPVRACRAARIGGWLMATELRACGVDFSFAPVLDLRRGVSSPIGDRAFHGAPRVVVALARAFHSGMRAAGYLGVGKHFPGHGSVASDSHHTLPVDRRPFAEIRRDDLLPFRQLAASELAGIIPAHVVFAHVDSLPAGFPDAGFATSCAVNWDSGESCSATTSTWLLPPWPATMSIGRGPRSMRAATWRCFAMTGRGRCR